MLDILSKNMLTNLFRFVMYVFIFIIQLDKQKQKVLLCVVQRKAHPRDQNTL